MKRITLAPLVLLFAFVSMAFRDQDTTLQKLPVVNVKSLDGQVVSTSTFTNDGKPIIVDFWATWCVPCKKELNEIAEVYGDWQTETGVKLIAISIDDQRNSPKVKPYVESKEWPYEVYLDENQDLKRAMNVNNVPHVFVLNGKGEIVWQTNVYNENGGIEKLHDVVAKVAKGEKPE
jgi:cytochrome c biogenesis protein CcmG, thiol:disulfide interchange protein DsbE